MINLPESTFVIEPIASKDEAKALVKKVVNDYRSHEQSIESSIFTDTHPQSIQKLIKREYIDTIERLKQEGKITIVVSPYVKNYPAGNMKTLNLPDKITTMDINVAEPILDYHPFSLTVESERNEVIVKDLFTGETANCPREMRPELDGFTALGRTPNIAERILLMKLTGKYIKTIEVDERTIVREPFTPLKNIEGEIWYYPFWEVPIIEKRGVDLGIIEVRKKRPGHKIHKDTTKLTTSFENAGAIIYDGITAAEIKKANIHSYFDRDDKSNLDVKIESKPLEESERTGRLWLFTKMLIIVIIILSGIVAVITAIRHGSIQSRYKTLVDRGQYEDLRREISRRRIKLSKSMIQAAFRQLLAEHDIDSIEKLSNAVRIKPQLSHADVQREYKFFAKGLNIQGISKLAKISKHPPGENILKPVYEILSTRNDLGNFLEILRATRVPPAPGNVHHFYDILFKENRFEDARMLSDVSGIPPLDSKVQSIYIALLERNDLTNFIKLLRTSLKSPIPETVHRFYDILLAKNRFENAKMLSEVSGIPPIDSNVQSMYRRLLSQGRYKDVRKWMDAIKRSPDNSMIQSIYKSLIDRENYNKIREIKGILGIKPYYEIKLEMISEVKGDIEIYSYSKNGNRLYCKGKKWLDEREILAVDISNPHLPRIETSIKIPAEIVDIACDRHLLFVIYNGYIGRKDGLRIFKDKGNYLDDIGYLNLNDHPEYEYPNHIIVKNGYAYVSVNDQRYRGRNHKLVTIDITNPTGPRIVHTIQLPDIRISRIKLNGNYMYCLSQGKDVNIINLSKPRSPEWCGVIYSSENLDFRIMEISKKILYIVQWYSYELSDGYKTESHRNGRIIALDISNPKLIRRVGLFELPLRKNYKYMFINIIPYRDRLLVINNNYYYIIGRTSHGLKILYEDNFNQRESMHIYTIQDTINGKQMFSIQDYLYMTYPSSNGLKIYKLK